MRKGSVERNTKETQIQLELTLDGGDKREIQTGLPFFDHMLDAFARHGFMDLRVNAKGDIDVDGHHTVEDVGICMGLALRKALAGEAGIRRYGSALLPMDETLAQAAVDISGRPFLAYDVPIERQMLGTFDTALLEEFFRAFATNAGITLHIRLISGTNAHHIAEAVFKGVARALAEAAQKDGRLSGVPSTKGML